MTPIIFNKFNKFIFYPDLSNKFLLSSYYSIVSPKKFNVYLKYIFNDHSIYNPIAIKALLMLSSIYPERCLTNSRLILVKFAKNRCISSVFFKLNFNVFIPFFSLYTKKPVKSNIVLRGFVKESKYFIFPGFIKYLRFPFWNHSVALSYKQTTKKHLYFLLFYKTAYLD